MEEREAMMQEELRSNDAELWLASKQAQDERKEKLAFTATKQELACALNANLAKQRQLSHKLQHLERNNEQLLAMQANYSK